MCVYVFCRPDDRFESQRREEEGKGEGLPPSCILSEPTSNAECVEIYQSDDNSSGSNEVEEEEATDEIENLNEQEVIF